MTISSLCMYACISGISEIKTSRYGIESGVIEKQFLYIHLAKMELNNILNP